MQREIVEPFLPSVFSLDMMLPYQIITECLWVIKGDIKEGLCPILGILVEQKESNQDVRQIDLKIIHYNICSSTLITINIFEHSLECLRTQNLLEKYRVYYR